MNQGQIKAILADKDYDVNVITSVYDQKMNGQVATWVTQVSAEPALIAVCVAPERYTNEFIAKSGVFIVNMLAQDQADLVPHFGYRTGREFNKFEDTAYTIGTTGAPVLGGIAAYVECRVVSTFPGGDHQIYVGEIIDGAVVKGGPRISYQWLISRTEQT